MKYKWLILIGGINLVVAISNLYHGDVGVAMMNNTVGSFLIGVVLGKVVK